MVPFGSKPALGDGSPNPYFYPKEAIKTWKIYTDRYR